jgi:hypothetical protein
MKCQLLHNHVQILYTFLDRKGTIAGLFELSNLL